MPDLCHTLRAKYREVFPVNRIDQPVEGLVLFAKSRRTAANLSEQMRSGRMKKEYLCIVRGSLSRTAGTLENMLIKDPGANVSRIAKEKEPGAKKARLDYSVLASGEAEGERYSLLHIRLDTGRHHQIRVQLAGIGHPVAGDRKYAEKQKEAAAPFPMLCAFRLSFADPVSGAEQVFTVFPKGKLFGMFEDIYRTL